MPASWACDSSAPPGCTVSAYHSNCPASSIGPRMRSSHRPSGLRSDGVAWAGTRAIAGAWGAGACCSKSASGTPRALARRQTTATVGLAWARSICESMDLDTPARRDNSSSDNARAWRSAASVSPTRGGSAGSGLRAGALVVFALREAIKFLYTEMCSIYCTNRIITEHGGFDCPRTGQHTSGKGKTTWQTAAIFINT